MQPWTNPDGQIGGVAVPTAAESVPLGDLSAPAESAADVTVEATTPDRTGGDTDAPAAKRQSPRPSVPKWEQETKDRIKAALRKLSKPLEEMIARDANEGDTRHLVTDMLVFALGYDKYEDLTTEYRVKNDFADYGIRIDKQLVAFIEVKRCAQKLGPKHLRQVQMYAVNEGVEWMLLTNGQVWQAYHLSGGLPVQVDLALDVDILSGDSPTAKANALFFLSKESLKRRQIDDLWAQVQATSPPVLAQVLLSDAVVEAVRKEIRRQTGQRVEPAELRELLSGTVIRDDCMDARPER